MEQNKTLYLNHYQIDPAKSFEVDVKDYDLVSYQPPQLSKARKPMKVPISIEQMLIKFKEDGWDFSEDEEIACRSLLQEVNFYTFKHYAKKERVKTFSATKSVYDFDMFLQSNLQELTSMIEKFIRTVTVDSLSCYYDSQERIYDSAQFYLDDCLYFSETGKQKRRPQREKEIKHIQYGFFKTCDNNKEYPPVKKELDSYGAVSAWVLFDLITFGQMSFFFSKLVPEYKKVVVSSLNEMNCFNERITDKLLSSWINAIRALRNKVSHGMKVYGEPFTVQGKVHDKDKEYLSAIPETKQNYLVNVLLAMRRIVMCMSQSKQEFWNEKMCGIAEYIESDGVLSEESLGLTDNWLKYFLIEYK